MDFDADFCLDLGSKMLGGHAIGFFVISRVDMTNKTVVKVANEIIGLKIENHRSQRCLLS